MSGEKMDRELISAEIHKCYCRAYERRFGKPYWTNGDYSKLDEATKDYDREMADWHIKQMETRTPPSGGEETMGGFPIDRSGINPLLTIVKKAVEMGLVRVNKCKSCEGYSITLSKHCPACSGSGVVVEEGE